MMNSIEESFGLKEHHKQQIITLLRSNLRVKKIELFGSRARGCHKENSDIDLVIEGKDLTLSDLAQLMDSLEETSIPYKIDLLIKHNISNASLLERIEIEAVRWF